jgi:hypothetical protein
MILVLFIISLSACSNSNQELERLKAENERLKTELAAKKLEIEDLKFGSEKLYAEAEKYFNEGNLQKSKDTLNLLFEKHPTSKEAEQGKSLLAKVEDALKKEQEAEELAEKKKAEEEKQRVANATKNMRKTYDEVTEITWYYDKTSPQYTNRNGFFLYIGQDKTNNCWLRLRIQYAGNDWVFIEKYIIKCDDLTFTIDTEYGEVKRDNSGGMVWEWLDKSPSKSELDMINSIIKSKKTILRCEGDQYHHDREITEKEKQAFQNILDTYAALGGGYN